MTISARRSVATLVATVVLLVLAAPGSAKAARSIGGSGVTYNRSGEPAVFRSLRPIQGMNCASARYVMNNWLRRAYARTWSNRLPTRFFDGYVTWYCGRTSTRGWRCDEYETNTAFRFVAYRY